MAQSTRSERFAHFAAGAAGESPLYEVLAREIAADAHLLALASFARPGQPAPNLLLAAWPSYTTSSWRAPTTLYATSTLT
ncbi:MAG: DUF2332 family protein [Clostridia bacterium]